MANAAMAGQARKAIHRDNGVTRPLHHAARITITGTIANKLGLTPHATAAAAPATAADQIESYVSSSTARDHQKAATASLIGCDAWNSSIGDAAQSAAERIAVSPPPIRRPSRKATRTSPAADSGVTANCACSPATAVAAAKCSGSPGGYPGTATPRVADG